jgi:hypothetical protein
MNSLSNERLEKTIGGEVNAIGVAAIVAGVVFVIGVIEGIVNPKKCG